MNKAHAAFVVLAAAGIAGIGYAAGQSQDNQNVPSTVTIMQSPVSGVITTVPTLPPPMLTPVQDLPLCPANYGQPGSTPPPPPGCKFK